jgi:hypothetical protein
MQIPPKCILSPHKTLGHYKVPAGNGATQVRILKTKSNNLGKQVSTRPFNKHNSWTFNGSNYLPSMGSVLPQSFFTAKQFLINCRARLLPASSSVANGCIVALLSTAFLL